MAIWSREYTLEEINRAGQGNLVDHLGIRVTQVGEDFLEGEMPVDPRTRQPFGMLHGGASAALAETLASTAGNMTLNTDEFYCVGLEINANHLRACRSGQVTGVARPLHRGRTTQVWEIRISQDEHLVCVSRMTLSVLSRER